MYILGSPFFLLGFYGTDNKFTFKDITSKTVHITSEFEKRNVKVLCSGSDGDVRFLKSQKFLLNFGNFKSFGEITLAGDMTSKHQASQDPLHISKKMKNCLYDQSDVLRIGRFSAALGHLVMVFKRFDKNDHGLLLSDLDPSDKMNYK